MSVRRILPLMTCALLAVGGAALAQQAAEPDVEWDLVEANEGRSLIAAVVFSNGIAVSTRCNQGTFEAVVHGLPESRGERGLRQLRVAIDEPGSHFTSWYASDDGTAAFSSLPAIFARTLREGGELNVTVPGARGEPNRRFVMRLPESPAAIDQTLAQCDKPSIDPRDAELADEDLGATPAGRDWVRRPNINYPEIALSRGANLGYATISCLALETGALSDCEVESEYPANVEFGKEALRAASRARLNAATGSPPLMVSFMIAFRAI